MKYVYAILDPATGLCRYVGCSVDPAKRVAVHRTEPYRLVGSWLATLSEAPEVEILEEVEERDWRDCERGWIERRWREGHPLLNVQHVPGRVVAAQSIGREICHPVEAARHLLEGAL